MDHGLGLFVVILEILEIEVFIFPRISVFFDFSHPGNLEIGFFQFLIWWKYGRRRAAPGVRLWGPWIIFGVGSWNFVTCPISGNNGVF